MVKLKVEKADGSELPKENKHAGDYECKGPGMGGMCHVLLTHRKITNPPLHTSYV